MAELEFTTDELLEQARGNETGLWHACVLWAKQQPGGVDAWASFIGKAFAPSWDDMGDASALEVARVAGLNFATTADIRPVDVSGDEARAVLISLNPGQEMGDHQVKENAWVTVLHGRVRVSAGGETHEAGVGSLFRFDPDERHSLASDEGARIGRAANDENASANWRRSPSSAPGCARQKPLMICCLTCWTRPWNSCRATLGASGYSIRSMS